MNHQVVVMTPEEVSNLVSTAVRSELGAMVREFSKKKSSFTEKEAAEYLGYSVHTLSSWRRSSKGPAYRKGEKGVRYERKDLDAFKLSERVITSESPDAHC